MEVQRNSLNEDKFPLFHVISLCWQSAYTSLHSIIHVELDKPMSVHVGVECMP